MQQHDGTNQRGSQGRGSNQANKGSDESLYGQATEALSDVADRASDLWDDAYDQGERYYRQGSRAVAKIDGSTVTVMLLAGAIGYAIAWMIHGDQPYGGNWARGQERHSGTRQRHRGEHNGSHRRDHR
jgi:hypothetical protein